MLDNICFAKGSDKIDLTALGTAFDQLQMSNELPGAGDPLVEDGWVTLAGGRRIRLVDFLMSDLGQGDFLF